MRRRLIKNSIIASVALVAFTISSLPTYAANTKSTQWTPNAYYVREKENSSCIYISNESNYDSGYLYVYGVDKNGNRQEVCSFGKNQYHQTSRLIIPKKRECFIYNYVYENTYPKASIIVTDKRENIGMWGFWSPDSVLENGHTYTYIN